MRVAAWALAVALFCDGADAFIVGYCDDVDRDTRFYAQHVRPLSSVHSGCGRAQFPLNAVCCLAIAQHTIRGGTDQERRFAAAISCSYGPTCQRGAHAAVCCCSPPEQGSGKTSCPTVGQGRWWCVELDAVLQGTDAC